MPNSESYQIVFNSADLIEEEKVRLDVLLYNYLSDISAEIELDVEPSRSKCSRWIKSGAVSINGASAKKSSRLISAGEEIELKIPLPDPLSIEGNSDIPLRIIHEEKDYLIVDKQAGLVVHPGAGEESSTLVHALVAHLGEEIGRIGDALRPGLVHRLDKDTTGLMVVAKNETAFQAIKNQFNPPRTIHRKYYAITRCAPNMEKEKGEINLALGRSSRDRRKFTFREDGKEAITRWKIAKILKHGLCIEVELETGRTHQIRAHFHETGASLIGDPLYGGSLKNFPLKIQAKIAKFNRQALHAYELSFLHPRTKELVTYSSKIPTDLEKLMESLDEV